MAITTGRWAWRQPSFKESVTAHWSKKAILRQKCIGTQVVHRNCE